MAKKFLTPLALFTSSTDPVGIEGAIYYNRADGVIKFYDGSTWNPISSSAGLIVVDGGSASSTYIESLDGGNA